MLTCWAGMRSMIRLMRRSIRKIMDIILGSIRRYSSLSMSISRILRGCLTPPLPTKEMGQLRQLTRPSLSSDLPRAYTRQIRSKPAIKSHHPVRPQQSATNPPQTTSNPSATKPSKPTKTPSAPRTKPLTSPKWPKTAYPATTPTGATS